MAVGGQGWARRGGSEVQGWGQGGRENTVGIRGHGWAKGHSTDTHTAHPRIRILRFVERPEGKRSVSPEEGARMGGAEDL